MHADGVVQQKPTGCLRGAAEALRRSFARVSPPHKATSLEDIRVTIEGTRLGVLTDPQGQFGLSGDFAGRSAWCSSSRDGGRRTPGS